MRKLANSELHRLDIEQFKKAEKTPLIVILDNVRSLNNVGSVFRTCDAFLVEKIYLCGITATPPNKEIHKTALGATDSVAWEYAEDTLQVVERLKAEGVCVISIEQAEKAVMLNNFQPKAHTQYAVIFGNEGSGVADEILDEVNNLLKINMPGCAESLNVSIAAGIVMHYISSILK